MKLKNDTSRGMYLPEQQNARLMHFVSIQISPSLNVQFAFMQPYRCFSGENVSSSRLFKFTFNTNSTGGKVSNHHILFNFAFHVKATHNYRKLLVIASPRVPSKPSQNAYMLLIQYLCPFIMLQRDYWDHCLSEAI